jgi:hypothetical protein
MRELQKRLQFKFKLLENVSNYLWKAFEKLQAIFDRNTDEEECLNQYTQKVGTDCVTQRHIWCPNIRSAKLIRTGSQIGRYS